MKRDATGRFKSNWDSEAKRRFSITLTSTAWQLLEEEAQRYGISRSEVVERTARSFAPTRDRQSEFGSPSEKVLEHGSSSCDQASAETPDHAREAVSAEVRKQLWEQQQTIASLQRQQQELEALLENAPDAIARFDSDLRYCYVNRIVEQALGIARTHLLGKRMNEVLSDPIYQFWEEHLHRAFTTGREQQIEFEFETPFGVRFYQARLVPEQTAERKPASVIVISRDMTETKQAENQRAELLATQEAERRVSTILENITDAFVAFDRNWCYTYVNHAAAKILHKTPAELLGKHVWNEVFPELAGKIAYQQLHRAMQEQVPVSWEECEQPLQRWLEVNAYPSEQGVALYFRDITQRKQLEAELQDQKQQYEMLAENSPDIIARFDTQFRHLYISPCIERATGLSASAFIGKTNEELGMPKDLCLGWRRGLEHVLVTGQEQQFDFQFSTPQGKRWYQSHLVPEFAEDGSVKSILGITRDFHHYKQAEQALRQSEERLRFALNAAGMVAWEWNPATGQVVRSHTSNQIIGIGSSDSSTADSEFFRLIHPDDRDEVLHLLQEAIAQRSPYAAEFRIVKPDGSLRWMLDQGRVLCNDDGSVIRMSGVIQDITERKRMESALRESELKFRTLADTMPQLFWITRPDGYHEYFNQRWFEYTGMTLEQTQGWGWNHLLHPDDQQRCLEVWQESLRTGNDYAIEYRFQRASDGEYRWFLGLAFPLRDPDGQILKWFGSCTDIHDQRCLLEERDRALAQEQSARQHAEAANRIKDEFLAVLSHELRTPLNPILGWSRLLRRGRLDAQQRTAALETIERNAELQTQLIDDLLDISRILQGKLSLKSVPVDLAAVMTAAIETVRLAAEAKSIRIQTHIAATVRPVLGDPARLQQVVWNLLTNAVKFTPPGGQVEVWLEPIEAEGRELRSSLVSTPHARVTVSDTGKGIPPAFLPYVFDTFRQADSTTTRSFGGLGLGLAIVRHLVELHGGTVQVESTGEGQGATFTVTLPLITTAPSTPLERAAMTNATDLHGITILAVDDDADSLELVQFILEQAGATVMTASLAAEALEKLPQSQSRLLIADIAMPQVDGYTLMQQVRALPPENGGQVPAIALTAYAGEMNQQQAIAVGFQRHLTKPVDPEALLQTITELLHPT